MSLVFTTVTPVPPGPFCMIASQLPAGLGLEVNGHSHIMFCFIIQLEVIRS